MKKVHLFVFPGFADWEPAHAIAELRRNGNYDVEVVGISVEPVVSMGGMTVQPTRDLSHVHTDDVAVFILPGGDSWEHEPVNAELTTLLRKLDEAGVPIAAICGATIGIARIDLLHGRRHTSNGLTYMREQVPSYSENANYVDAPAVRDRGLITASGLADVEFAAEIMTELEVLSAADRALWTDMFRSGRIPDGTPSNA